MGSQGRCDEAQPHRMRAVLDSLQWAAWWVKKAISPLVPEGTNRFPTLAALFERAACAEVHNPASRIPESSTTTNITPRVRRRRRRLPLHHLVIEARTEVGSVDEATEMSRELRAPTPEETEVRRVI